MLTDHIIKLHLSCQLYTAKSNTIGKSCTQSIKSYCRPSPLYKYEDTLIKKWLLSIPQNPFLYIITTSTKAYDTYAQCLYNKIIQYFHLSIKLTNTVQYTFKKWNGFNHQTNYGLWNHITSSCKIDAQLWVRQCFIRGSKISFKSCLLQSLSTSFKTKEIYLKEVPLSTGRHWGMGGASSQ